MRRSHTDVQKVFSVAEQKCIGDAAHVFHEDNNVIGFWQQEASSAKRELVAGSLLPRRLKLSRSTRDSPYTVAYS